MSFAARLTRHPIAHVPERGAEALAQLGEVAPDLRPLIAGAAGSAPYLAGLIAKEADWLRGVLPDDPEDSLTDLIAQTATIAPDQLEAGLRRLKRRAGLLVGLADLGGLWSLHGVTRAWTDFADACLARALSVHVATEARRGKLPGLSEADVAPDAGGMAVLAMGKMGAGELNYSSDIDLICLFDDARFEAGDAMDARAAFIRATRRMAATLSEVTADGYVFRTDLRLRPDASVTPVCISMTAAERYYEAEGRSWERSAFIKARAAAGDIAAGERFLAALKPFVWRRHLDFATVQDTMDMRRRIRDHKGLHAGAGGPRLEGHDLKLGAGGIRDIEFFAQTRQLVAGGRDPSLRARRTVKALSALARAGWIPREDAGALAELYAQHRETEHRVQMIDDAQTHALPVTPEGFDRLARLSGEGDTARFRAALSERLSRVEALTGALFAPAEGAPSQAETRLGAAEAEIVARWPGYPALRSERGLAIFERLKPELLRRLQATARPIEALATFDAFLKGLPAGVQLFALFEATPSLVDLLVDICGTAPALSRYLARHSGVLDAVLDGRFFAPWPGASGLTAELSGMLAGRDYEAQLDLARRWQKDWHFRIGVHQLRGLIDAGAAATQYTDLADAVIAALWPVVCAEIAHRHGPAPGLGGAVVGMGSLGGGRMTAGSDLDLIVIYDAQGVEETTGPRPLAPRGWFAKATKALITALSAPMAAGRIYEVDMRLRPSGRQGPVATSVQAFADYQRKEAWIWEHMALSQARGVTGSPTLLAGIDAIRRDILGPGRDPAEIRRAAADMRARLSGAGPEGSTWEVKDGAGGLRDIEMLAQAAVVMAGTADRATADQLGQGGRVGWLAPQEVVTLTEAHRLFADLRAGARLVSDDGPLDPASIGAGGGDFLARITQTAPGDDLASRLDQTRTRAHAIIDAAFARPLPDKSPSP